MPETIFIPVESVAPTIEGVLKLQGVPAANIDERMRNLAGQAILHVQKWAEPKGKLLELRLEDFEEVYRGEGRNDLETPLEHIYNRAEKLALYAVTLGPEVGNEISRRFGADDFVDGAMLDAAASEATELAAAFVESWYRDSLSESGLLDDTKGVLQFSPGYCGWHISGQRKLFDRLKPETLGITLSDSFLMQPLKSISGVMISGSREIFVFEDNYAFCSECRTHSCQTRIRAIIEQLGDDWT